MFKTNHHTPKTVQANSLPFEPLMEKLQANGFAVGVKDFIEFIKIFEAFETESADDLKYYLAPLICRCQEEQQAFYRIFDQWISDQYDRNQQIRTVQANKKRKILIYSLLCLLALVAIWFLVKPSPWPKIEICISDAVPKAGDTVFFSEGCNRAKKISDDVNFKWLTGDGTVIADRGNVGHVYKTPGKYKVRLEESDKNGKVAGKDTLLTVCPVPEILSYSPGKVDTGTRVYIQPLKSRPRVPNDSLVWVIKNYTNKTDTIPYEGKAIKMLTRKTGTYDILVINKYAPLLCPLATASFSVKVPETAYFFNVNPIGPPLKPQQILNNLFPFLSASVAAVLVMAIFWIIAMLRSEKKEIQKAGKGITGGNEKPADIPFENKDKLIRQERNLIRVFSELQQRVPSDLETLDIGHTIRKTISNYGLFTPAYTAGKNNREYLLLIDGAGTFNQQIYLFTFLVKNFIKESITVSPYYFFKDTAVFYNLEKTKTLSVQDLKKKHEQAVLIVISDGHRFVNKAFPALLPEITEGFSLWEKKILVTPTPARDWNTKEKLLGKLFSLAPADLEGWIGVVKMISSERPADVLPYDWKRNSVSGIDFEDVGELKEYLDDDDLFQWVCALAIHHRIRWEITLSIGQSLLQQTNAMQKLNYTNLLKIARINWIKDGVFPGDIRLDLLIALKPGPHMLARKEMLGLLRESDHLITADSFSYAEKQMQEYTDSLFLYGNDRAGNSELKSGALKFLELWQAGQVADMPLKIYLQNKDNNWEVPLKSSHNNFNVQSIDVFITEWQKQPFVWKWPKPLYALITFMFVFPFMPLINANWVHNSFLNKVFPLTVENTLIMNDFSFKLDTNSCFRVFTKNDSVVTVTLSGGSGDTSVNVNIRNKDTTKRAVAAIDTSHSVTVNFSNISRSITGSRIFNVTIKSANSVAVTAVLAGGYKQYGLSIVGPSCKLLGPTVFVQYDKGTDTSIARTAQQCILQYGYDAPGIEKVNYKGPNVVRYLVPGMKNAADSLAAKLSRCLSVNVISEYTPWRPRTAAVTYDAKQLEIWLSGVQTCQTISFNSIRTAGLKNFYSTSDQSKSMYLYKDSIVIVAPAKKLYRVLVNKINDCAGLYTFYIINNSNKIIDSIRFTFNKNQLAVLSGPGKLQGTYLPYTNPATSHILWLDDHPDPNNTTQIKYFRDRRIIVDLARTNGDAYNLLSKNLYAMVITDIRRDKGEPCVNSADSAGIEFVKGVKFPKEDIIVYSAESADRRYQQALINQGVSPGKITSNPALVERLILAGINQGNTAILQQPICNPLKIPAPNVDTQRQKKTVIPTVSPPKPSSGKPVAKFDTTFNTSVSKIGFIKSIGRHINVNTPLKRLGIDISLNSKPTSTSASFHYTILNGACQGQQGDVTVVKGANTVIVNSCGFKLEILIKNIDKLLVDFDAHVTKEPLSIEQKK